jgi:hypothetical protein
VVYHAGTVPRPVHAGNRKKQRWEGILKSAGNPLNPTLEEAIAQALTPDEAEQFIAYLRPLVETMYGRKREAWAYLWAVKHERTFHERGRF